MVSTGAPTVTADFLSMCVAGDLHACPLFYPTVPPTPHGITPVGPGSASVTANNLGLLRTGDIAG